jgi:hypothetical protein
VYSYNFPNDKRSLKCLGEYKRYPSTPRSSDEDPYLAYFTFIFETAQTAMNGADVYYWFIEGFGNMEHLRNPHLGPIDAPIGHAVMSLVIQLYFSYRIWVLDRRLLVLCIFISMVHGRFLFFFFFFFSNLSDSVLCMKLSVLQAGMLARGAIQASTPQCS